MDYRDKLAMEVFGMTRTAAHEKGICLECKLPAAGRCMTEAGIKEYNISALCEVCFDSLFGEVEQ